MMATCEAIQLAVVHAETLDDRARGHVDACAECKFLVELSRDLGGVATHAQDVSVLGAAFTAALVEVVESGAPLLGRYRLDALRGRGGQGHVYRATDLETGEVVAVKIVRATSGDTGVGEVANARSVRHANVCRVFHTERHGDIRLIIMEYLDGPTLAERREPMPLARALAVIRAICDGVAAAHAVGVLHLDLKPGNVILRGGEPVVTDFGLSRRSYDDETGPVQARGGTPRYMAPEQLGGRSVDVRTDVHALGRILEELVPSPPRRIASVIRTATAADPAKRLPDVAAFAARLTPVRRRWPQWVAIVAGALAAVLAVLYAFVTPPHGPRATYREDLWGIDRVPAEAWNVALDTSADGNDPSTIVETEDTFACATHPRELVDGVVLYSNWEHGVGWRPAPNTKNPAWSCVNLSMIGRCGTLAPEDRLCEVTEDGRVTALDIRARDVTDAERARRPALGRLVERIPCGWRSVTLRLDEEHTVIAVRSWYHNYRNVPRSLRVRLRADDGAIHEFRTNQNFQVVTPEAYGNPLDRSPGAAGDSAPVTIEVAPARTREIELSLDTCTTLTPEGLAAHRAGTGAAPGDGWLYEIEVFALLPRHEAWRRWLAR